MLPRFLTVKETAQLLKLPEQSIRRLCRQERLPVVPGVKPWRIITAELEGKHAKVS